MTNKTKGLVGAIIMLLASISMFVLSLIRDTVIIAAGIKTYKFLHTANIAVIVLAAIACGVFGFLMFKENLDHKQEEAQKQEKQKTDPLYDEASIIEKLIEVKDETTPSYRKYADQILQQMDAAKNLQDDFVEIVENNNQPIIENIANELFSIRVHMLQDAKSIHRRLIIAKDANVIEAKLNHNDKILNDAEQLVMEAINYIDVKSNPTEIDLHNLTESLKDLMKLI